MLLFVGEELSLYYSESQNEGKRMVELRAQEQQLLTTLESLGGKASVDQLIDACSLPDTAVMRVGLTLQEKNLIKIHAQYQNIIKLTAEGEQYAKKGLPERNLIRAVADLGGAARPTNCCKESRNRNSIYPDCPWLGNKKEMGTLHLKQQWPTH